MNGSDGDTPPAPAAPGRTPPLPQLIVELRDLLVEYFKQETVVPLKQLGRYVAFGLLGALLLGFGAVFLGLAGLRALQTETDTTFTGNWSWAPYLIMVAVLLVGGMITWQARGAVRRRKGKA
ncbi:MAG TPA: phage holin family protein [Acidimicrobiia bacterium]